MNPERWQQVDRLFHSALEREPTARAAFLEQACTGDEALRREVESLVESHEQPDSFIESPAADLAAELLAGTGEVLAEGQAVGPYKIVSLLGEGGMGEVYLAQDERLGRQVALKLLPAQFTRDADRVQRFEQEARAVSALNHPNIVTIHEIGNSNSQHFITTEFIDGETLRQHMASKQLNLEQVLDIATQIASALAAAHAAGIVHRDIKPENVMLRRDGIVKVLDFGLAKLASQEPAAVSAHRATPTTVNTNPGMVLGTVQYMSPEQARGKDVDARTDIWSLGVVLYEMVAGHVPFKGETQSHALVSLMELEPVALTRYAKVPSGLERIVTKALCKTRDERYQTANDLARDLKTLKQELEIDARLKQPFERERFVAAEKFDSDAPTVSIKARPTSGVDYLVSTIRRNKRIMLPALATLAVLAAVTAGYFGYSRRAAVTTASSIRSLAVLPFTNASNNADMEYLADGLAESLTNNLSPIPGLTVIARSSSFEFKGKEVDPNEVAKRLGVDAIITARVAQLGNNFLVNVELVDARNGKQVWGKQYTRDSSDLLSMQSEITREITQELRLRLTNAEQQQLTQVRAVNPQAFDLYLKGRALWVKGGDKNTKKAIEYYQQAITVDPGYALVYAQLANSYSALITNDVLPQKEFGPKEEAAALKAVELDDNLAEAHLAVANVKIDAWDWTAAEREIKRALELNPNLVAAHRLYGQYHANHRRLEESVAEFERARDLDPLSMADSEVRLIKLTMYRQNAEAIDLAKKVLELNKSHPGAHERLGALYVRVGQYREAIAEYQESIKLGKDNAGTQILLAAAYAHMGERDKAREILQRYESEKDLSPVTLAMVYVALGDRDQTFALLEKGYAAHDQTLIWLRGEWEFDVLHDDPRFQDLARRIGLM